MGIRAGQATLHTSKDSEEIRMQETKSHLRLESEVGLVPNSDRPCAAIESARHHFDCDDLSR